jgi:two-component system cell cycle response regulator
VIALWLLHRLYDSRQQLRAMNADLVQLARIDRLTGLPNRLHLEEELARVCSATRRQGRHMSVFVIDVDRFKSINDRHGHASGDDVLRELAKRWSAALRVEDTLGRWGGEEFLCILPNSDCGVVTHVAERLRAEASQAPIMLAQGTPIRVTVSIGCATLTDTPDDEPIQRADTALYEAKQRGRDRVVMSLAPPGPDLTAN